METIITAIGTAATAFGSVLGSVVTSAAALFYTPGVEGAAGELTFVGQLLVIAVGAGLVFWGVRLIRSLIQRLSNGK